MSTKEEPPSYADEPPAYTDTEPADTAPESAVRSAPIMPEPAPTEKESTPTDTKSAPPDKDAAVQEDSDPDFDDLDDVLDQFSANAISTSKVAAPKSEPGKPSSSEPSIPTDIPVPSGPSANETSEDFLARLTSEMQDVMGKMSETAPGEAASKDDLETMGKQLEDFTYKMEKEGIAPEDILKAILGEDAGQKVGDAAHEEKERRESESQSRSRGPETKTTFEDTIRKTMERMEESGNKATSEVQQKSEEDMLADMLKAMEAGGEGDGDLSKMFLGMMEQLTNKDTLYEPMTELNTKFPQWLSENKGKLKKEDYARYARQKEIVKDIVSKFESKGYTDEDPQCREYIWEKMQKMQEQGAPPEDLVSNPFPGMGGGEAMDEGCPTQ